LFRFRRHDAVDAHAERQRGHRRRAAHAAIGQRPAQRKADRDAHADDDANHHRGARRRHPGAAILHRYDRGDDVLQSVGRPDAEWSVVGDPEHMSDRPCGANRPHGRPNRQLTTRLRATAAVVALSTGLAAADGGVTITLKHGTPTEAATRDQLRRLMNTYDLSPWFFTS